MIVLNRLGTGCSRGRSEGPTFATSATLTGTNPIRPERRRRLTTSTNSKHSASPPASRDVSSLFRSGSKDPSPLAALQCPDKVAVMSNAVALGRGRGATAT